MERGNNLKIETQNLTGDPDAGKEKFHLLGRNGSFDLERLNLEENLRKSRRRCEELEEKVVRLLREIKTSNDREQRANELRDKIFAEHMKMTTETNKLISALIREKLDAVKAIEELRAENSEANKIIEELRAENSEANKIIEELRVENSESNKIINEMKLKKLESNEVELYRTIDEVFSNILTSKPGHTADLAEPDEKIGKLATSEGRVNLKFPGSNGSSGNRTTPDAAVEIAAVNAKSPVVRKSPISTESKNHGMSKKGDRNSVQHQTREDDDVARTVNIPRVSQPVRDPLQAESNRRKEQLDSGVRADGMRLLSVAQCSTKPTCSLSAAAGDIIVIVESDDETNLNEKAHIPNRVLGSYPSKNNTNFVQNDILSEQRSKRNRADSGEGLFAKWATKKKRNRCPSVMATVSIPKMENRTPRKCAGDKDGPVEKFNNGLKDKESESSDDKSLSDSRMDALVASLRNKALRENCIPNRHVAGHAAGHRALHG